MVIVKASSKDPTASVSFRITSKVIDRLRKHANRQQIGLNTLVSQIFTQYLDWGVNAGKAGFIPAPKFILIATLEKFTKEELDKLASDLVQHSVAEMAAMMHGEFSGRAVLSTLDSWARASSYEFRHESNGNTHTLFIQHDLGYNWSYLLTKTWELMFSKLDAEEWKSDISPHTVWFSVEFPQKK
jgi:hypothetical protein